MKFPRVALTIAGVALAGGVLIGGIGLASADTPGGSGHGRGMHGAGTDATGPRHEEMQATLAATLGITVEQLQAELAAGKTVQQIAQERGVDLTALHAGMQGQHKGGAMGGTHGTMGATSGGPQHGLTTMAQALGLTAEQLQAELAAGKTVQQIAQERGVDLNTLHAGMQGQHRGMGAR